MRLHDALLSTESELSGDIIKTRISEWNRMW